VALCQGVHYLGRLPLGDLVSDRFRLLAGLDWRARRLLAPLGAALLANSGTAVLANSGTAAVIPAFSLILSGERALAAPAANRNKPMAAAFCASNPSRTA
jgi:hypothetical protein